MTRRFRSAGTISIVLALAVSCGSTVDLESVSSSRPDAGLTDTGLRDAVAAPATNPALPGRLRTAGAEQPGFEGAAGRGNETSRAHPSGVAVAKTVEIGIEISKNAEALFKAAGGSGGVGDNEAQARAVINWINSTGGIAGQRVVPVWHTFDAVSSEPMTTQQQAGCATWTEDHHVFAAVSPFNLSPDVYVRCLGARGAAFVGSGYMTADRAMFDRNRAYFVPNNLNIDRLSQVYVDRLVARGFLTKANKIGLLYYNEPRYKRARDRTLIPRLAARGLRLDDQFEFTPIHTQNAQGSLRNSSSEASAAVLRFSSRGIDRVLFLATGADIPLFFMQAAESQRYRPKYGMHTLVVPVTQQQLNPSEQQQGSVGVGWWPLVDVDANGHPPDNKAEKNCLSIMSKAGVDVADATAREFAFRYCDGLFFIRAALARVRGATADRLISGSSALGSSWQSSLTFGTRFAPARRDGAAFVRDLVFQGGGCNCYRYDGPARSVS